jgi:hypothetical protein
MTSPNFSFRRPLDRRLREVAPSLRVVALRDMENHHFKQAAQVTFSLKCGFPYRLHTLRTRAFVSRIFILYNVSDFSECIELFSELSARLFF